MKTFCMTHVLVVLLSLGSLKAVAAGNETVMAGIIKAENSGRLLAAMSQAKAHYRRNKGDDMAKLTYGRLMVKNGKAAAAIAVLKPLANTHGDDWRPWFWLGSAQLMSKDLESAAWSMDEALAREGNNISLWVQRAVIEQERGNPQMAVNMLQVADSIQPGSIDVLVNYAYALEQTGEYDKASAVYRRFLKMSAASAEVGRLRSRVLARISNIEQAKQRLTDPQVAEDEDTEYAEEEPDLPAPRAESAALDEELFPEDS